MRLAIVVVLALACGCGHRSDPVIITNPAVHDTVTVVQPDTTHHHHHPKGK